MFGSAGRSQFKLVCQLSPLVSAACVDKEKLVVSQPEGKVKTALTSTAEILGSKHIDTPNRALVCISSGFTGPSVVVTTSVISYVDPVKRI